MAAKRSADQDWVEALLARRWGSPTIISRGRVYDASRLPGLVAWAGKRRCGLATFDVLDRELELVTLDALEPGSGAGSALLREVEEEARRRGCGQCVLITTNDNLDALAFYQKRGWRLTALRPGAIHEARELKPSIPMTAENGIPIRDELELWLEL